MINILFIILQVILLDGILSIDNAAALAAIAKTLPNKKAPLPKALGWLGHKQPDVALKVGILGAYIGRGTMLLITGIIISFPLLKVLGALYLLWLVYKYFFGSEGEDDNRFKDNQGRFWKTVLMIEIADLAFSVDNVVAVVALSPNIWIIILGVCISILIMRFAASIFMRMIDFEPTLQHAAYILILAIALELLLKTAGIPINEILQFSISVGIILAFLTVGQLRKYRERRELGRSI